MTRNARLGRLHAVRRAYEARLRHGPPLNARERGERLRVRAEIDRLQLRRAVHQARLVERFRDRPRLAEFRFLSVLWARAGAP